MTSPLGPAWSVVHHAPKGWWIGKAITRVLEYANETKSEQFLCFNDTEVYISPGDHPDQVYNRWAQARKK